MVKKVFGAALSGLEPFVVTVEADVQRGLPKFEIVGLAQNAVQEGRNRIAAAIRNCGVVWNSKKVTVNLAPAEERKEGALLDAPIALSLLAGFGVISVERLEEYLVIGELSLDGTLRAVRGALAMAHFAKEKNWKGIVLPFESAGEATLVSGLDVIAPRSLHELLDYLRGERTCAPPSPTLRRLPSEELDWSDVGGQESAKRAMEIAAAGGHNILLGGPPGVGKTLLARRLTTILPRLNERETREIRIIHSLKGDATEYPLHNEPPFRAPHHHASLAGMVGGGKPFGPGEFSLAHNGVLFMDELPEYRRDVLEALREPLEVGRVTVSRADTTRSLSARFLFVGAMNLCPCGMLGDQQELCRCTPPQVSRYQARVSGPVRDRVDLHVYMPRPKFAELWNGSGSERSETVRLRVESARALQFQRNRKTPTCNARLGPKELRRIAAPDDAGQKLLQNAAERYVLSARGIHRTLAVARTIADLDSSPTVRMEHVAEALQYSSRTVGAG